LHPRISVLTFFKEKILSLICKACPEFFYNFWWSNDAVFVNHPTRLTKKFDQLATAHDHLFLGALKLLSNKFHLTK